VSDSPLLTHARAWIADVHPNARHLERALERLVELAPDASESMRIAAVMHDYERAFPDHESGWESAVHWDSRDYLRWHQDRSADMVANWLSRHGAPAGMAREAESLVRVHEHGGWRAADLVQAADSLSFLETMDHVVGKWVTSGRAPRPRAEGKLRWMAERISHQLPEARAAAALLLDDALARLPEPLQATEAQRR
jgi:hypothetical protein